MIKKLANFLKPKEGQITFKWASPFIKQDGAQIKYRVKKSVYHDKKWNNSIVELDSKELEKLI